MFEVDPREGLSEEPLFSLTTIQELDEFRRTKIQNHRGALLNKNMIHEAEFKKITKM